MDSPSREGMSDTEQNDAEASLPYSEAESALGALVKDDSYVGDDPQSPVSETVEDFNDSESSDSQTALQDTVGDESPGLDHVDRPDSVSKDSNFGEAASLESLSDDEQPNLESKSQEPHQRSVDRLDTLEMEDKLDFEGDDEQQKRPTSSSQKDNDEEEEGEEGECDDGDGEIKSDEDIKEVGEEDLEEGEVSSDEDLGKHARMEPRPMCRFYSKGHCTWGHNCRFLHPGVMDKGNYDMFAPARPIIPQPAPPPYVYERPERPEVARPDPVVETAWERGLRQAKEMVKKALVRKETDIDFEEKKKNLGLGEEDLDKENDYYTRPASPVRTRDPELDEIEAFERAAPPVVTRPPRENWHPPAPVAYHAPRPHAAPHHQPAAEGADLRTLYRETDYRERERIKQELYERQYFGGGPPPRRERDPYYRAPLPPPPPEKPWQEGRHVEVVQHAKQHPNDWVEPWTDSKSPTYKGSRRRSYSSGSSSSTATYSSPSRSPSHSRSSSQSSLSSYSGQSGSRRPKTAGSKKKAIKAEKKALVPKKKTTAAPARKAESPPRKIATKPRSISPSPPPTKMSFKSKEREKSKAGRRSVSRSRSRSRSRSVSSKSSHTSGSSRGSNGRRYRRRSRTFAEKKRVPGAQQPYSKGPTLSVQAAANAANMAAAAAAVLGKKPEPPKLEPAPPPPPPKKQIKMTIKPKENVLKKNDKFTLSDEELEFQLRNEKIKEKEREVKPVPPPVSPPPKPATPPPPVASKKRQAESPPHAPPPAKVASKETTSKPTKKSAAASRREELLKQLKAVEDAIARKRSKIGDSK